MSGSSLVARNRPAYLRAMHSSGSISHYQGADPDLLHALTRMLADTGRDLLDHRTGAERVLASVGGPVTAVADVRLVEAWIDATAADSRRRAEAARDAIAAMPWALGMVGRSRPV